MIQTVILILILSVCNTDKNQLGLDATLEKNINLSLILNTHDRVI